MKCSSPFHWLNQTIRSSCLFSQLMSVAYIFINTFHLSKRLKLQTSLPINSLAYPNPFARFIGVTSACNFRSHTPAAHASLLGMSGSVNPVQQVAIQRDESCAATRCLATHSELWLLHSDGFDWRLGCQVCLGVLLGSGDCLNMGVIFILFKTGGWVGKV